MTILLVIIHVIVSLFLIGVVLLQTGKGAEMGAAFGGSSSQTIFGSRGPGSFLGKLTTVAAIIFIITSFSLAFIGGRGGRSSVIPQQTEVPAPTQSAEPLTAPVPAVPAQPAKK
ncbi:MAG: preprotein translocase subunit SecG [Nitrospirae bacterium]|nr:preprotein translocase subunit SecG [Nitrospirota bacterium]